MDGLNDFDEGLAHTLEGSIGRAKLRVLPLERIIAGKRAADREPDTNCLDDREMKGSR